MKCAVITRNHLTNPISVRVKDKTLDFAAAKEIADAKARELHPEPMLLGWYDGATGRFSPNVECCSEEKPGWLVYAESRGGNVTVDINDETFVFIYGAFPEEGTDRVMFGDDG